LKIGFRFVGDLICWRGKELEETGDED